ncbi:MAG: EamA family transporter [Rickettsiales bacterium]|nr:MAG: EamA family transporter [Rickettsiales bacterium]
MTKLDIFFAIFFNLLLATTFSFSKYLMSVWTPVFVYSIRFLIAGVFACIFYYKKLKNINKVDAKWIFLTSFFKALSLIFLATSLSKLDSSMSAIVNRLDIVATILLSVMFFNEKVTLNTIIGVIVCFFAIYIFAGNIELDNLKYLFIALFCPLFMACENLSSKKISLESTSKISIVSLFCGIFMFLYAFAFEDLFLVPLEDIVLKHYMYLIYLAFLPGYLAYLLLYYLLKKYPSTSIMPYNFIRPVLSIFVGFLVLGESITQRKIIATILILIGVFITQYKKQTKIQNDTIQE